MWRGYKSCGMVTQPSVARLPNLWRDYRWLGYLVARLKSSQLAPKPIRPNQIQPTRPNTGSPQYRHAPVVLPGSQLQLQQRCNVTL